MIKHESITVTGVVIYCDGCGKRGHEEAYDNINELIEAAMSFDKWDCGDNGDYCPECVTKRVKTSTSKRSARKKVPG